MNITTITAIGVIAAIGAALGCSDQSESRDDRASTMEPGAQQSAPAPEPTMSDDQQDPVLSQGPHSGPGQQPGEKPMGPEASEFASFDTDSNGQLGEDEWEANAVGNATNLRNMSFAQIDRDSSGTIDLQEFRQAKVQDGGAGQQSGAATEGLDPTEP